MMLLSFISIWQKVLIHRHEEKKKKRKKKRTPATFFLFSHQSIRAHFPRLDSVDVALRLLPPERAALGKSGLTAGGLTEDGRAAGADDDGLCVREDGGDVEAAGALNVHEEGAGGRHKGL